MLGPRFCAQYCKTEKKKIDFPSSVGEGVGGLDHFGNYGLLKPQTYTL